MFARHIYNSPAGFLDSDLSILLFAPFSLLYNNYIIYFLVCQCGKSYARARWKNRAWSELEWWRVPWVPPSAARPNKQAFVAHIGEHRELVSGARECIWGPTFNRKKCHMGLRGSSRALPGGQRPAIISYFYKIVKYFFIKNKRRFRLLFPIIPIF